MTIKQEIEQALNLGHYDVAEIRSIIYAKIGQAEALALVVRTLDIQREFDALIREALQVRRQRADSEARARESLGISFTATPDELRNARGRKRRRTIEDRDRRAVALGLPVGTLLPDVEHAEKTAARQAEFETWGTNDHWAIFSLKIQRAMEEVVAERIEEFMSDLLVPQLLPDGTSIRRADLTAKNCDDLAGMYLSQAGTEAEMGLMFQKTAEIMNTQNAPTMQDIDWTEVKAA